MGDAALHSPGTLGLQAVALSLGGPLRSVGICVLMAGGLEKEVEGRPVPPGTANTC